jgi:heme-degrading monooxygenase HmoA
MYARFSLITADPLRLGGCLKHVEAEVRPGMEMQPGSLGTAMYADAGLGLAFFESCWASEEALAASAHLQSLSQSGTLRQAAGTATDERYRLPVFEYEGKVPPAARLRLTRMDIEPAAVADAVEAYGDTAVSWLAETDGFFSMQLLVNDRTGHAISETVWRDPAALAASRRVSAEVRAETAVSAGWSVRAVEEYSLIFSSARTPL